MWSTCSKTCGTGTASRRRTCNDDSRSDVPKELKTCKGVQREEKACDNGKCNSLDHFKTKGEDSTGLSAPKVHFGTRQEVHLPNPVPVDIPPKRMRNEGQIRS